jgi:hypothetical protein
MNPPPPSEFDRAELATLLNALVESQTTEAERNRIEQLLSGSAGARRYYANYMLLRAALLQGVAGDASDEFEPGDSGQWSGVEIAAATTWPHVRPYPVADAPPPAPPPPILLGQRRHAPTMPDAGRFWRRAAAVVLVSLLGSLLYLLTRPDDGHTVARRGSTGAATSAPLTAPATLLAASGAMWEIPHDGMIMPGQRLPAGTLALTEGLAEVRLDGGATVVIEAPARFRIDGPNAADLHAGRLAATVPPAAHGFAVQTPSGRVVDLGTEFGVHASPGQSTALDVFVGKVQVAPRAGAPAATQPILTAGQAAAISTTAVELDPVGALSQRFVRHLTSDVATLDVVDLLTGGDGATHRRGMAINPASGASGPLDQVQHQYSDSRYHRVTALPVVDGCFIPNGVVGPVVTDSAGHAFPFPATTGRSFDLIWAGGLGQHLGKPATQPTILGQDDLTQNGHGALAMHSNMGLTLDLAAVRRLYPDKTIARFRCRVGNGEPKPHDQRRTDLFVLVDGQPRFQRIGFTHAAAPVDLDIALSDSDHFLTLAVTDGGDQLFNDGILWGDPAFDLDSR